MITTLSSFIYIASAYALLPPHALDSLAAPGDRTKQYDWDNVPSTDSFNWESCYEKFECTRLTFPLDWNDVNNPNNVSLPLIRLPAGVRRSDHRHGGTIITNPGGPGGSGVWWATESAARLQRQIRGQKDYDILSFDPRGIFNSRPNAYCFQSAVESEIWMDQKQAVGSLTESDYSLKFNWVAEKARGEVCGSTPNGRYPNGDNIRQFISTASVARDMLHIVDKLDEDTRSHRLKKEHLQQPLARSKPQLQYFGTSYGTFLGQTFASMFPDRVARMVLDANVDPYNWVSRYEAGIDDHNAARQYFFERCFAAKTECAFHRGSDDSPKDVAKRYDDLLLALDAFPRYAYGEGRAMPITRASVEDGFMTTTYQPLFFFKLWAVFLNDLLSDKNPGIPFYERAVPTKEAFTDDRLGQIYQGGECGPAVHCGDGPLLSDEPISAFKDYLGNLTKWFGPASAGIQADYKIGCWTWPKSLRTKWRYDGPFEGNVSILFLNNRLDPATAAKNAKKMAGLFEGSVFLEQDSVGHGAMWPGSECIEDHVKEYFDHGKLPKEGTVCQPRCQPFEGACSEIEPPAM